MTPSMLPRPATLVRVVMLAAVAACGGGVRAHRVLVPPRLDLLPYRRVALVTFTGENAKGSLPEVATARFSEDVLASQSGIELLELGSEDTLVARVGEREFGPAAAQALGRAKDVPAVFVGHLKVSGVKPEAGLLSLAEGHVAATVSAELTVRLLSTESGGTLWRSSAVASDRVGELSISGGVPYFAASDPKAAYGSLVDRLMAIVTRDLRPTWQER